jgi:hypothetical protein
MPAPRFIAVVVFATPPFWFAIAIIRLTLFPFFICRARAQARRCDAQRQAEAH